MMNIDDRPSNARVEVSVQNYVETDTRKDVLLIFQTSSVSYGVFSESNSNNYWISA